MRRATAAALALAAMAGVHPRGMTSPAGERGMRVRCWRRFFLVTLFVAVALGSTFVGGIAYPQPFFSHSVRSAVLEVRSDAPIPDAAGRRLLSEVEARIGRSPLAFGDASYRVYVVNSAWRERWIFVANPRSGGYRPPFVRRHVFLRGADFEADRLFKAGEVVAPPRTLAYYATHEVAHLLTIERLGHRASKLPVWIGEGLADYVALVPRETFEELRAALEAAGPAA